MTEPEVLRKVSDDVFEIVDEKWTKEGHKPLHWRRGWHQLHFKVSDIRVYQGCKLSKYAVENFGLTEDKRPARQQVVADPGVITLIEGRVEGGDPATYFSQAVKLEGDEELFEVENLTGPILLEIRPSEPSGTEGGGNTAGLYPGSVFPMDHDPGPEDLCISLTMPEEYVALLVSELKEDPSKKLDVRVQVFAYTYEVDDALREPFHSQQILIQGSFTDCIVISAWVTSAVGYQTQDEEKETGFDDPIRPEVTTEELLLQRIAQTLDKQAKAIAGLGAGLWVLVLVAAINLFK
jgi:hypothetical protein